MFKSERQNQIYSIIVQSGFSSVKDLSEKLFTSESSIRRDLAFLEKKGLIKRSYGYAEIVNHSSNVLPFSTRTHKNIEAKQTIAHKAKALIKEGDVVFLDQSSSSYFLATQMVDMKSVTVITNNLEILNLLAESDLTVHSSGGIVSKANRNCLIGNNAQETFNGVYADIAFISTKALSDDGILTDCTQEELFVRSAMLSHAAQKVYLCDSSKVDTRSSFIQGSLADIDILVSESDIVKKYVSNFPKLNIL